MACLFRTINCGIGMHECPAQRAKLVTMHPNARCPGDETSAFYVTPDHDACTRSGCVAPTHRLAHRQPLGMSSYVIKNPLKIFMSKFTVPASTCRQHRENGAGVVFLAQGNAARSHRHHHSRVLNDGLFMHAAFDPSSDPAYMHPYMYSSISLRPKPQDVKTTSPAMAGHWGGGV